ncbi:hypothetical protein J4E89_009409 [Alternaria sp. Ai002NY15]|nr:hypothetical protein J4E89_009409 [Alternaria sp. Ai002NY15]
MGQQQKECESHHNERQAVLSDLDVKIDSLDIAIASLMAEQHTLKRVREYVLSAHDKAPITPNGNNAPPHLAHKLPMRPTYPSPFHPARKARSCLRQEVLIRNAMDREKSSSPPGSVGLLSSDEFEASFPEHDAPSGNDDSNADGCGGDIHTRGDVRPSVEGKSSSTAENHSAPSSVTTANAISRSNTPSPDSEAGASNPSTRNGQGAHWQTKRVAKRKLQENAAKAREVRRRKLAISAAVRD